MRHPGSAAEHVPDAVARAFTDAGLRADHRHPGADLAVEPGFTIGGVCLDSGKTSAEQAQSVVGGTL